MSVNPNSTITNIINFINSSAKTSSDASARKEASDSLNPIFEKLIKDLSHVDNKKSHTNFSGENSKDTGRCFFIER